MITTITKATLSALALAAVAAGAAAPAFAQSSSEVPISRVVESALGNSGVAGGAQVDPLAQFLRSIAQAGNTGSAVPLPPCTPGTVTNIGCEPRAAHATAAPYPVLQSPAGTEIGWFPTYSRCEQAAADYDNAHCYPADGGWALMLV
ncbi:hypothetical protein [Nocardia salmonicida]|uniref:hypothetical protein n=1 Tax=Nocardia salmonicida TaxID=53431 RepID=UPI0036430431